MIFVEMYDNRFGIDKKISGSGLDADSMTLLIRIRIQGQENEEK
jgi:hypothetical protein